MSENALWFLLIKTEDKDLNTHAYNVKLKKNQSNSFVQIISENEKQIYLCTILENIFYSRRELLILVIFCMTLMTHENLFLIKDD
jgi:hypothetical protein